MSEYDREVVHVESDETAARIVAGFLESEGIEASIVEDDAGDQIPALEAIRGVKVVVPAADAARARELLAARQAAAPDGDDD